MSEKLKEMLSSVLFVQMIAYRMQISYEEAEQKMKNEGNRFLEVYELWEKEMIPYRPIPVYTVEGMYRRIRELALCLKSLDF